MTRGAAWYWRRLQAMSFDEVLRRSWRAARYPIEQARMRAGRYPRVPRTVAAELARWDGPKLFYPPPAVPPADDVRRIVHGERRVLGLGWLALPDPPWHVEPAAGASWPLVAAATVIAAAPAHFDPRLTWEFNRGHEWVVLATAGEIDRLAEELASWRAHNPIGIGINWASPMEAAIRLHSFAWVAAALRDSSDRGLRSALGPMMYEHAMFVADHLSFGSSANNHLIVELSGLIIAARVLALAALHRRAIRQLEAEVARQVHTDGVDAEMATHYHAFVLEALQLVAHLERVHGEPRPTLERTIAGMTRYLEAIRCGDGSVLEQGDHDDGRIVPLFVPPTNAAAPAASHRFEASGQIVLRSARLLVTFDAGPFGFGSLAAHAHCDALAINVAFDGRPVLVDRGTFRYNGDSEARDRYRMTAAHNTVQVDHREQGETAGGFLWSRQPRVLIDRCSLSRDGDLVIAHHDGFSPSIHRRTLLHADGVLVAIDEVDERATARLHLAPGIDPDDLHMWAPSAPARRRTKHSSRYGAEETAWTLELPIQPGRPHILILTPSPLAEHRHTLARLTELARSAGLPRLPELA
jgi:hypothetical protein